MQLPRNSHCKTQVLAREKLAKYGMSGLLGAFGIRMSTKSPFQFPFTLAAVLVGFGLMCGFEMSVGGHHHSHGGQDGHLGDHHHLGGHEHTHGDEGGHFDFGHQVHDQSGEKVTFRKGESKLVASFASIISI